MISHKLEEEITTLLDLALKEDHTDHDITSRSCFTDGENATAHILLKEDAKIAGLLVLPWLFKQCRIEQDVDEGSFARRGTSLASITGPLQTLLSLERTALNLLQHCSGIATKTSLYVKAAAGLCDILDTRKTLPGLRQLQKYAVRMGGGKNHRFHLEERILIKNNHLALTKERSIKALVEKIRRAHPTKQIEVEVETLEMLQETLQAQVDFIMLDNMSLDLMKEAVKMNAHSVYLEASGNMTLERIPSVAQLGVDGISVGALTHSVDAIDISFTITKEKNHVFSCKRTHL